MALSNHFGESRKVTLPRDLIVYRECGASPPMLFVHGAPVNADSWRNVVPVIADAGFRCITPEMIS